MKTRLLLLILVLFFSFQSGKSQDTLRHVTPHKHKTHISDSSKKASSNQQVHLKDTARKHHSIIMPKYPRDGYVAIMGGFGFPFAAFSSNAGAATGSDFSINASFPGVISHWGIAFKFDYGINGLNKSRVENIADNTAGFGNINCSVSDTLGHCTYSAFLAGIYLTYPHKHITYDIRILFGAMIATMPSITVTYNDQTTGNAASYTESAASGSAFAIDLGFEARYPVCPRIAVFLSADYLHAIPTFPVVRTGATLTAHGSIVPSDGSGQIVSTDQSFNVFSLSLGVGYTISAQKPKKHIFIGTPSF